MSQPPKQIMSGLRSIKRDFSSNSIASTSQEPPENSQTQRRVFKRTTSGMDQRLKDIQAGLDELAAQKSIPTTAPSSHGTSTASKRPSSSEAEPAAKRRHLPSSWSEAKPEATTQSRSSASTLKTLKGVSRGKVKAAPGPKPTGVFLSDEQTHILKLVESGQSVFYTGSAGTGKSVLLREIIKSLRKTNSKAIDAVAITASTGIAACNIGGVTIHSFAGIGIGIEDAEKLADKIKKNKKALARWLRTKVLIIDEVSMVDGKLFDKLARVGSLIRKDPRPFGGIQLVVTGDFFQLPPVAKGSDSRMTFAFEAELWGEAVKNTFNLTKVFRQSDPEFVDMLNEMRFGRLSAQSIAKFKGLAREVEYDDGVAATELFPRREDVEASNRTRMRAIDSDERTYRASESGTLVNTDQGTKLLSNFMVPQVLTLKIGAQVMLIKNMDDSLVNGSMGTVVEFADPASFAANNDDEFIQKPVSSGGDKKIPHAGVGSQWPVVEFLNRRRLMVQPETWKVELPNGEIQVSRTQLPLILSWAMSIHKSQGQTLERVKVNLAKVFEKGQAYVALSRATSLEGLQVLHFDANKVQAHPKVVEWSKTLRVIET